MAVCYARVSTDGQTLDAQHGVCVDRLYRAVSPASEGWLAD
jgi:hypothetical protein